MQSSRKGRAWCLLCPELSKCEHMAALTGTGRSDSSAIITIMECFNNVEWG